MRIDENKFILNHMNRLASFWLLSGQWRVQKVVKLVASDLGSSLYDVIQKRFYLSQKTHKSHIKNGKC